MYTIYAGINLRKETKMRAFFTNCDIWPSIRTDCYPFRLLDTVAGNEPVETTAVFSVDELAQIRAINRQHTLQIDETQIRIQVGFLLLHP